MNDGCALVGRHGRAHRRRPYPSPSYFSTQSHINKITIYMQSTKRHQPRTQSTKRNQPPTRNPPKRNRRGGACVPARTSAQRRFHPKMRCCHPQTLRFHLRKACFHVQTRCFYPRKAPPNDGCALAGRHGRAHRHRPYHA